jgi:hypothetical protein
VRKKKLNSMNARQIERFFQVLAKELDVDARAILTGAAAGALWGRVRPSVDVDFALELRKRQVPAWEKVERAIERTVQLTGIQANYAEDIDRWGLISLLDYGKHTRAYRRFGRLRLELLEPAYWSIGKMTRYLEPDVQDMVDVFRRRHISWKELVSLWGRALRASPKSAALGQFRRQVEHFLRVNGRTIWGRTFSQEEAIRRFHSAAKIRP